MIAPWWSQKMSVLLEQSGAGGQGGKALRKAVSANADAFAASLTPVLQDIRGQGHATLRGIAAELNTRGIRTRRGGRWHVSTVMNLVRRIEYLAIR